MTRPDIDTATTNSESDNSASKNNEDKVYGLKRPSPPLKRLTKAAYYSIKGIRTTFRYEQAFRFEVYALLVAIPLSMLIAKTPFEYLLLIGSVIAVMIVELLNTGIEMIVDRVGVEHHELSGRAKDAGSAAVFMTMILAAACWILTAIY